MSRLSIRARLTASYIAVLAAATLTLAGGAWWLFETSMTRAADASLAARVEGTRRFIDATEHELPPEEVLDEFQEFANLTRGEALLEVSDEIGRTLCRPDLRGWESLRVPTSAPTELKASAAEIAGQPYRALSTTLAVGAHRYAITTAIPMATAYGALHQFGWLLVALVPAVMLVAGAGGFWLSGRALAPVDRMTRDVQFISVRDSGRRLDVPPAGDELSRLAATFNGMLGRWQDAFADVVRFTADASHELRTPLSLIRTTSELALARPRGAEEYRTALAEVHAHARRMSSLVEDLLTLARADAGVEPPVTAAVDLRDLASQAVEDVRPAAAGRSLALDLSVPDAPVMVCGGEGSLHRLLLILLDNAVKYTPAGGWVRLRVSDRADAGEPSAVVEVLDSGIGISSDERPRVFDRFYRGSGAREAAPDGSGLGLSIARTIVERHRGRIAVSSASAGGCSVEIVLPLMEDAVDGRGRSERSVAGQATVPEIGG